MRQASLILCCLLLLCGSSSHQVFARATTGNIKGKVTDVTTKESLPGVNILIVGSGRGGVTNPNGEYFVTGVTPGEFTVRVSAIGYQTIEAKKVRIDADETAVFDFQMASEDIEVEGVTVEGKPPLVDVTKTAGDQTFNREKIEQLPNVKGVEDVLGLQAGVVKFGGQLFLRGGRANETQILIDGVVVNDVGASASGSNASSANEQLQQLYSGNSTAGAGGALSVAANAIQSVSVSSSGLDAEFGNAQSGVVNITTKTGGDSYSGSLQYRTDGPTSQSFNERYYAANIGGPEPITNHLLPSLGIDFPGKMSFFMSGNFNQTDGPHQFTTSEFYNPTRRKIKFGGFLGGILKDVGFTYSDKQNNDFTFNTKLSYSIGESDLFSYSYRANASSQHPLVNAFSWINRADSSASRVSLVTQDVLQWTHILGTNSLLKGYVSRLETDRTFSIGDLAPTRYSMDLEFNDLDNDGFNDLGTSGSWNTSNTVIWNAKFDYSSQVHPLHFLKGGFEYFYEDLRSTEISRPGDLPREPGLSNRGAYPGIGYERWVSNNTPSRGAFYVQDNIEFTSINIHIGLRYDWLYLGKQVYDSVWVRRWREAFTSQGALVETPAWLEDESFFSQFTSGSISPRLSIGYPISTRTVFYFNYGHFLQIPDRSYLFRDPIVGDDVGNPGLKPQKTVQYEAGFDQLLFDDLSIGIRGFYKDIFDYISQRTSTSNLYVNLDYASVRGFEVILNKQLLNRWSGSLGYTFQLAKGRSSDPRAASLSPELAGLPREVRLDYDQEHTLNVFAGYRVGPKEDFDILGLEFNNWGVSFTWSFGSGFPYTPIDPTVATGTLAAAYLINTKDSPSTSEVNVNLYKGFSVFEKLNLTMTVDITNLFDRRNIDRNAGGFNAFTGRPISYGDYTTGNINNLYEWRRFGATVPPFVFGTPRQIAFGLRVNWD